MEQYPFKKEKAFKDKQLLNLFQVFKLTLAFYHLTSLKDKKIQMLLSMEIMKPSMLQQL